MKQLWKKLGAGTFAAMMTLHAAGIPAVVPQIPLARPAYMASAAETDSVNVAVVKSLPTSRGVSVTYNNITSYPLFGELDFLQEVADADGNYYAVFGGRDVAYLMSQDETKATVELKQDGFTFGAATIGDDNNVYVIWGKNVVNGEPLYNVVICKYSLSGKLLGQAGIDNTLSQTAKPFDAGNAQIGYHDGVVCAVYNQEWHSGHQGTDAVAVSAETMKVLTIDSWEGSHSFGIAMIPTEEGFAAIQRGDVYERGLNGLFYQAKGGNSFSTYKVNGKCNLFHASGQYGESNSHQNDTHLGMGGIAKSGESYAIVGKSERFYTSANYAASGLKTDNYDVFVRLFDINTLTGVSSQPFAGVNRINEADGTVADRYVVWLTSCDSKTKAGNTKIVTLGDGNFCVLWERFIDGEFDSIRYVILDKYGNPKKAEKGIYGARLSSTMKQPLVKNHTLTWALADGGMVTWVTVDLDKAVDAASVPPVSGTEGVLSYITNSTCATITKCAADATGKVTIPEKINGKPVWRIAAQAFESCKGITAVEMPDTVSSIGAEAFANCEKLQTIDISTNMKALGEQAFADCFALQEVALPDQIETLGDKTFYRCKEMKQVNLPEALKSMGFATFYFCKSLEAMEFPDGMEEIGSNAVAKCYKLKSVTLPDSVTLLGKQAFYDDTGLESVRLSAGLQDMGDSTFEQCTRLKTAVIPEGVSKICANTFNGCRKLSDVTIGDSVSQICLNAFAGTALFNDADNDVIYADGWVVGATSNCDTDVVLAANTRGIADGALNSMDLSTIVIPKTVKDIGEDSLPASCTVYGYGSTVAETFASQNELPFVEILDPEAVLSYKVVGDHVVITGCDSTAKGMLIIPETLEGLPVTQIADGACAGCSGLISVVVPENTESIGKNAFANCSNLGRIRIQNPDCAVYDASTTICNTTSFDGKGVFTGVIVGYELAPAESYASKYGYTYEALHRHQGTLVAGKEATCTTGGKKDYYTCACGKLFEDEACRKEITDLTSWIVIPATGHDFQKADIDWGDYKTASATLYCSHDATHTKKVSGLTVTKTILSMPNCTETGSEKYSTVVLFTGDIPCTYSITIDTPANGHDWDSPTVQWEGHDAATLKRVCKTDATHIETAKGVISGALKQAPTCTENGQQVYTATFSLADGSKHTAEKIETLAATGHSWGDVSFTWDGFTATATRVCANDKTHVDTMKATMTDAITKQPTCTAEGIRTYTATVTFADGTKATDTKQEILKATGHSWGDASFTWDGFTATATRVCANDKTHVDTMKATVTDAITKQPTCTAEGIRTYTATVTFADGTKATDTKQEILKATGHSWGDASFTWDGFTATATRVCQNDKTHMEMVGATVTSEITLAPTCTEDGVRTYTATATFADGTVATTTKKVVLAATTHVWGEAGFTWDGFTATATRVCVTDKSHVETVKATITGEITVAPTCTAAGKKTYTARAEFADGTVVTDTKTEPLQATGHAWGEATFTWDGFTATAMRVCANDKSHVETVKATITGEITVAPTCTAAGKKTYTARVKFADGTVVTDTKTETLQATGHAWDDAVFIWDGTAAAEAVRICLMDATHRETVKAVISSEVALQPEVGVDGVLRYTAKAEFADGSVATDAKTEMIPALTTTTTTETTTTTTTTTTETTTTTTTTETTTTTTTTTTEITTTTTTTTEITTTTTATTATGMEGSTTETTTTTTATTATGMEGSTTETTITTTDTTATGMEGSTTETTTTTTATTVTGMEGSTTETTITTTDTTATGTEGSTTETTTTTSAETTTTTTDTVTETTTIPTTPDGLAGDFNGDGKLSVADAVLLTRYLGEDDKIAVAELHLELADLDGDGMITLMDLMKQIAAINGNQ